MKKYLAWKKQELDSPALACPAPLLAQPASGATDWAALASSPPPSAIPNGPTRLSLAGPSAFSIVPPATPPILPALYPGLMCLPALLDRLGAQNILRSPMNAAFKPIPNNDKVDLARFKVKELHEWSVEDVLAWMLDLAKRHQIPYEEMSMHKFTSLNGQQLMLMNEAHFLERDHVWGSLIFKEFKKLNSGEDTLIDDLMKKYNSEEDQASSQMNIGPSTSFELPKPPPTMPQPLPPKLPPSFHSLNQALHQQQQQHQLNQQQLNLNQSLNQTLNQSIIQNLHSLNQGLAQNLQHNLQSAAQNLQNSLNQSLASTLAAGLTTGLSPMSLGLMQNGLSPSSPMLSTQIQPKISPLPTEPSRYNPGSVSTDYDGDDRLHSVESKIKKNKDGKPRKRSQHTKGNKLWEFIRDALKDPETCPSVVRWEDPVEGVFRIVESEKLARLWGERKNNTKMTYEKLSRAMRTYYEKQILVPVPKTGLYPKKLVYKFGPGAHGWDKTKDEMH